MPFTAMQHRTQRQDRQRGGPPQFDADQIRRDCLARIEAHPEFGFDLWDTLCAVCPSVRGRSVALMAMGLADAPHDPFASERVSRWMQGKSKADVIAKLSEGLS